MERQSAQKMINSTQSSSNTECQINFEHELLFHFYHGFWVSTQFNVEYFISRMYMNNFHLKALWAQWIWIAILRDSFLCFSFCICTNIKNVPHEADFIALTLKCVHIERKLWQYSRRIIIALHIFTHTIYFASCSA